ncbi:MAG: hypothetical protein ACJ71Z_13230 [Aeromicrobium sp.]
MKEKKRSAQVNLLLPEELIVNGKRIAAKRGIPFNRLVGQIIEQLIIEEAEDLRHQLDAEQQAIEAEAEAFDRLEKMLKSGGFFADNAK